MLIWGCCHFPLLYFIDSAVDLILLLNPILSQLCIYYPIYSSFHFYQEKRKIYYYITSIMHVLWLKCVMVIPLNHLVCHRAWCPFQELECAPTGTQKQDSPWPYGQGPCSFDWPVTWTAAHTQQWHLLRVKTDTSLCMIAEVNFESLEPLRLQASHAHPITSEETPISYQEIGKTTQLRPQLFKI